MLRFSDNSGKPDLTLLGRSQGLLQKVPYSVKAVSRLARSDHKALEPTALDFA